MEGLAPELRCMIMKRLDDFESLHNLIRASPSFLQAFIAARNSILWSILRTRLAHVYVHAIPYYVDGTPGGHFRCCTEYRNNLVNPPPVPKECPPKDQLFKLVRRNKLICYFSSRILSTITTENSPYFAQTSTSQSLTLCEEIRIQRALYRFTMCTSLFAEHDTHYRDTELWAGNAERLLWSHLKPWEADEFACIKRFLAKCLEVFEEVFDHDIEIAGTHHCSLDYRNWESYIISRGLHDIKKAMECTTYSERQRFCSKTYPGYNTTWDAFLVYDNFIPQQGPTQYSECVNLGGPDGPNKAYLWAHNNGHNYYWLDYDKADLHDWYYCLWSPARLASWGVLNQPWNKDNYTEWRRKRMENIVRKNSEFLHSLLIREDIARLGGSGYWSDDRNKRQIEWRHGGPVDYTPPDNIPKAVLPKWILHFTRPERLRQYYEL